MQVVAQLEKRIPQTHRETQRNNRFAILGDLCVSAVKILFKLSQYPDTASFGYDVKFPYNHLEYNDEGE